MQIVMNMITQDFSRPIIRYQIQICRTKVSRMYDRIIGTFIGREYLI